MLILSLLLMGLVAATLFCRIMSNFILSYIGKHVFNSVNYVILAGVYFASGGSHFLGCRPVEESNYCVVTKFTLNNYVVTMLNDCYVIVTMLNNFVVAMLNNFVVTSLNNFVISVE